MNTYYLIMAGMAVMAVIVFVALFFFKAGYGYLSSVFPSRFRLWLTSRTQTNNHSRKFRNIRRYSACGYYFFRNYCTSPYVVIE